jgi:hypothetical protein
MSSNLGRSLSVHRGRFGAGLYLWWGGGVCALGSVIGLFQALLGKGVAGQAGFSAIALPVSLGALAWAYMRWKQVLEIFEGGFVWQRLIGTHTVTRDQIKEITHMTHRIGNESYVELIVDLVGGKRLGIVGIEEPGRAGELLAGPAPQPAPAGGTGWTPPGASA